MIHLLSPALQRILQEILDSAIEIVGADFGNIQLLDLSTSDLVIVAQRGFPQFWLEYWNRVSQGKGTCGSALQERKRIIVEDVENSPIFQGTEALKIQQLVGVRAIQSTPLFFQSGQAIGMFSTHYKKPGRPTEYSLRLLDLLAQLGADAIEQVQLQEMIRKSQEEYKIAAAQAEEANQLKDSFLGIVSHELRTPLTAILSWAQLLQKSDFDHSKFKKGLKTIELNALSQCRLIDDLIDLAKIQSGRFFLEMKVFNPKIILIELIDSFRAEAGNKSLLIEQDIQHFDGTIQADVDRFRQIVWNILSNGIKFTPKNGTIFLSLRKTKNQATITISDNGIGFDQKLAQRIFERFTQENSSLSKPSRGLGLGLYLVKTLTEMQNGKVFAQSPGIGKGATFVLEFPLVNSE